MTTFKVINFDDIGTAPKVQVPNGYEGFTWLAYNASGGTFEGEVYALTKGRATSGTHSVQGFGFEMKLLDDKMLFNAGSIKIAATGGYGDAGVPMDVSVIGYRRTKKMHSTVLNSTNGPIKVDLNFDAIDKLQFISNAMEMFDVDDIAITLISPPNPPEFR